MQNRQEPPPTSNEPAGGGRLGYRAPLFVEYGDLAAQTHNVGKTGLNDGLPIGSMASKSKD